LRPYKDALLITVIILAGIGLWLDTRSNIDQAALFLAFQFASLIGFFFAVILLCTTFQGNTQRALIVLFAAVVWRVSFFPIMVFSGWVATLGEWLVIQVGIIPVVIYPTFLITMALLNWGAIVSGGMMFYHHQYIWAPPLLIAFTIAAMVSFTAREDLSLLPDDNLVIEQSIPVIKPPLGNPYFEAFRQPGYGLTERVLIFASGAMYDLIPHTPWSTAVKSILESEFRRNPKASSTRRVKEHYLSFRAAHYRINCGNNCQ